MMKSPFRFALIFFGFLLAACHSITRNEAEFNMSPSAVIFSFDDGPNDQGDTTARLLDVLKKYHIQALFCLLGENAEHSPELVRRMHDEGHYFINHGYADKWASKMGEDEFRDNLTRGEAAISAALGHDPYPKLYRPHGGFYNSGQERIVRDEGYILVPANIRIYDAVKSGEKQAKAVRKIIKKTEQQGGGIVLLHDARGSYSGMETELAKNPQGAFDRSWIPNVMEEIIPILLNKGFILNGADILAVLGIDS